MLNLNCYTLDNYSRSYFLVIASSHDSHSALIPVMVIINFLTSV
jgi:hypothetical protein